MRSDEEVCDKPYSLSYNGVDQYFSTEEELIKEASKIGQGTPQNLWYAEQALMEGLSVRDYYPMCDTIRTALGWSDPWYSDVAPSDISLIQIRYGSHGGFTAGSWVLYWSLGSRKRALSFTDEEEAVEKLHCLLNKKSN